MVVSIEVNGEARATRKRSNQREARAKQKSASKQDRGSSEKHVVNSIKGEAYSKNRATNGE